MCVMTLCHIQLKPNDYIVALNIKTIIKNNINYIITRENIYDTLVTIYRKIRFVFYGIYHIYIYSKHVLCSYTVRLPCYLIPQACLEVFPLGACSTKHSKHSMEISPCTMLRQAPNPSTAFKEISRNLQTANNT